MDDAAANPVRLTTGRFEIASFHERSRQSLGASISFLASTVVECTALEPVASASEALSNAPLRLDLRSAISFLGS